MDYDVAILAIERIDRDRAELGRGCKAEGEGGKEKKRGIRNSALRARRDTKRQIHLLPLIRYSNDQDCRTCSVDINFRSEISHTLHSQFTLSSLAMCILVRFQLCVPPLSRKFHIIP